MFVCLFVPKHKQKTKNKSRLSVWEVKEWKAKRKNFRQNKSKFKQHTAKWEFLHSRSRCDCNFILAAKKNNLRACIFPNGQSLGYGHGWKFQSKSHQFTNLWRRIFRNCWQRRRNFSCSVCESRFFYLKFGASFWSVILWFRFFSFVF